MYRARNVSIKHVNAHSDIENIAREVLKKYEQITALSSNVDIKAVAFNHIYSQDGTRIDLIDLYMYNSREFDNLFKAHGMTYVIFNKNFNMDQWLGVGRKVTNKVIIPKWIVIGKRGINKAKLPYSQIYFYDHIKILMGNKVTFDNYLEESIRTQATYLSKFSSPLEASIEINMKECQS